VKISDEIFRRGGLCSGFKDNYCQLIKYNKHKGRPKKTKRLDDIFSMGDSVIVDMNGKIVLESDSCLEYPYHLKV
jgi:hypothetical protein